MNDETTSAAAIPEPIPIWDPPIDTFIEYPTIRVVFTGLLAFCYSSGSCEVGVHNGSPQHFLRVIVWEDGRVVHDWNDQVISHVGESYFVYARGPQVTDPRFYQPTSAFRRDSGGDPRDIRWIVDLESSEFYGPRDNRIRLTKRGNVLRPRFNFNTGNFHTAWRTSCLFKRRDRMGTPSVDRPMGRIATHIGANILLGPRDVADVSLPGGYNTQMTPEKRYHMFIENTCDVSYDPDHPDPERHNDFHLFLSTFQLGGRPPYYLSPLEKCASAYTPTNRELDLPAEPQVDTSRDPTTDRAPCASAGYGSGGGLGG